MCCSGKFVVDDIRDLNSSFYDIYITRPEFTAVKLEQCESMWINHLLQYVPVQDVMSVWCNVTKFKKWAVLVMNTGYELFTAFTLTLTHTKYFTA